MSAKLNMRLTIVSSVAGIKMLCVVSIEEGTNIYNKGPSHMIKMTSMPVY